jgi:hypothetical protein
MRSRIVKLTRMQVSADPGSPTLLFRADGTSRWQGRLSLGPDVVPAFEGVEAWFLIEKPLKGSWRVVRRIHADGTPYLETARPDAAAPALGLERDRGSYPVSESSNLQSSRQE